MADFKESPSQTAGPYVHIGLAPQMAGLEQRGLGAELGGVMASDAAKGERITLDLYIYDGEGALVKDALVEIWQPGPDGDFGTTDDFANWGRQLANFETGCVRFETLKPGFSTEAAPHILIWIAARGINIALTTRVYFEDEDNSSDPVFELAGSRAGTMLAKRTNVGYRHDIYLQGERETVFMDA
ncbi:MAG: protocatechuate 3,4-dioxygenase subunit alpha [Pseudomonadota bacterium]